MNKNLLRTPVRPFQPKDAQKIRSSRLGEKKRSAYKKKMWIDNSVIVKSPTYLIAVNLSTNWDNFSWKIAKNLRKNQADPKIVGLKKNLTNFWNPQTRSSWELRQRNHVDRNVVRNTPREYTWTRAHMKKPASC